MQVENRFSPEFQEGFVEQCQRMGLDCDQTEDLFRKHANNCFIGSPNIYEGFCETVRDYKGPLTKSSTVRWMTPDMISLATECRLKYGSDALSQQMRACLQIPEPSWDTVPEDLRKTASSLSNIVDQFDYLPLNQKVMLASLAGAGVGGLSRTIAPSETDQMQGRGALSRALRGSLRGGAIGAGAGMGAALGSSMVSHGTPPPLLHGRRVPDYGGNLVGPANLIGAAAGGLAGNSLIGDMGA